MSTHPILARLAEYKPGDTTVRVVDAVLTAVPGVKALPPYPALPAVVANLGLGADRLPAATAALAEEGLGDVLWMSDLVDSGDRAMSVVTGLRSAFELFRGRGTEGNLSRALETDNQQRNDAALKALALAYMAWKAFPGSIPERVRAFSSAPAGQALLAWYAAIELALPFADNAAQGGGQLVDRLFRSEGAAQLKKLGSMAPGRDLGGVGEALAALTEPIGRAVDAVRPHLGSVVNSAQKNLPGAVDAADKVAGVLANAADVLPVYRYLGGRLAAEAAVLRARA